MPKRRTSLAALAVSIGLAVISCANPATVPSPTATTTIGFENVTVSASGYTDASMITPATALTVDGVNFLATYDSKYGTSSDTTISTKTDTTTSGYTNPYSAYPGSGAGRSKTFAVINPTVLGSSIIDFQADIAVKSVAVANTTYAALSMKNGDAFAKKFATGDYFDIVFSGINSSGASTGIVKYYLADFRTVGSAGILGSWATVDLGSLGTVRKIAVSFESSDVGSYGINTPLYVAVDNLAFEP
jgi:hypothetical protein